MRPRVYAAIPLALSLTSVFACSVQMAPSDQSAATAEDLTACPAPSASDDQARGAATVAFQMMRGAADVGGATPAPAWVNTILASQRYRVRSSGTGIEFDPTDPLYRYVSNGMKANLSYAQLDSSVAKYLSDALKIAFATTTGSRFPSVRAVSALANFHYPGAQTHHVADSSSRNDSHTAVVTGRAWCGTSIVTIAETVSQSWQFNPIQMDSIYFPAVPNGPNYAWLRLLPPAFHGTLENPSTPFNGPTTAGNPYLVVTVNGVKTNWSDYNHFNTIDCWKLPNETCTGTLEIDPVPYAEPGDYYVSGALLGVQSNPFTLSNTVLYADSSHAWQWATRTVSGRQEWGTFGAPVSLFGTTKYKYVKQY